MVVFVQEWLYLGKVAVFWKNDCNRAKRVVFGLLSCIPETGCSRAKLLYSGKYGCIRAKVVVFGQNSLYSDKVVVVGQKWL